MPCSPCRVRIAAWTVAAAAGLQLAACAATIDDRVRQAILEALPQVLGPAAHYDVDVRGATRQDAGVVAIERARAIGLRVQRPGAPVLDRVEAELTGVRIDRATRSLGRLDNADLTVKVLANDVAVFLGQRPELEDARATFQAPDIVTIVARPVVSGVSLPPAARISLRGRLLPRQAQLHLSVIDVRVAGIPFGPLPARVVERLINPLIDVSALAASAVITSARITDDTLLVTVRASRLGDSARHDD